MALGQKEAVIIQVMRHLPGFEKGVDNAILQLSEKQLEAIKAEVCSEIIAGTIQYSKDKTNTSEVRSYARSMVMNHLKKAKELNGGRVSIISNTNNISNPVTKMVKQAKGPKGVDLSLLPEELAEYAKTLV